jgi:hypothetical protein
MSGYDVQLDRHVGVGTGPRGEGPGQLAAVDELGGPLGTGETIVNLSHSVPGVQHDDPPSCQRASANARLSAAALIITLSTPTRIGRFVPRG